MIIGLYAIEQDWNLGKFWNSCMYTCTQRFCKIQRLINSPFSYYIYLSWSGQIIHAYLISSDWTAPRDAYMGSSKDDFMYVIT